jgi:hypothetical protein
MKKSLALVLVALFVGVLITPSCKKDDLSASEKSLTSTTWRLSAFETPDENFTAFFNLMFLATNVTYDFKKNGEYTVTTKLLLKSASDKGTWSMSEDGKQITIDGATSDIIKLDKKEFRIGANSKIMGQAANKDQEEEIGLFNDYEIVFVAK